MQENDEKNFTSEDNIIFQKGIRNLKLIVMGVFIFLILIFCFIIPVISNNNLYKEMTNCINNKDWSCAKEKYEVLGDNIKKKKQHYSTIYYNYYLEKATKNFENKHYNDALENYKKAYEINKEDKVNKDILKLEAAIAKVNLEEKLKEIENEKQRKIEEKNRIKNKIQKGAVYEIPTQYGKGYDKTISRYGIANIKKINRLMPKVAEFIAKNPKCTQVMEVDVSDARSTKNSLVFYADCGTDYWNMERFYITEKELNNKTQPVSLKDEMTANKYFYMDYCEKETIARLYHPSTYKLMQKNIRTSATSVLVEIKFKARNSFNLETINVAECSFKGSLSNIEIYEVNK